MSDLSNKILDYTFEDDAGRKLRVSLSVLDAYAVINAALPSQPQPQPQPQPLPVTPTDVVEYGAPTRG